MLYFRRPPHEADRISRFSTSRRWVSEPPSTILGWFVRLPVAMITLIVQRAKQDHLW